ncbi:MAG: hypothetical protein JXA72_08955 [Bacteroidales bacterium]|nr:hypothetical protein [Bacteroidales bacterium]
MKKVILLLIAVALMVTSCNFLENMFGADEFSDLPSSKRYRYQVGDKLLYKDDHNNVDTFTVSNITTDYWVSDKRYHYQYQNILLEPLSTNTLKSIEISNENNHFEIRYAGNHVLQFLDKIEPVNTLINGHLIKKTYNYNDTLVFHYQYGLLRYKENNRLLELVID